MAWWKAPALSSSDVLVIGSGPNGLAAAIVMARAGCSVTVIEAEPEIGGGARSAELTLPGFVHDVCSAVHPLAFASPFFRQLPLAEHGLEWIHPDVPVAHPLDDGSAVLLERLLEATAAGLNGSSSHRQHSSALFRRGTASAVPELCSEPERLQPLRGEAFVSTEAGVSDHSDAVVWRNLLTPLVVNWDTLISDILNAPRLPHAPVGLARFGLNALRSAAGLANAHFRGERARALIAGLAGHSMLPMHKSPGAAFGMVLAAAGHTVGWPFPKGGAQQISNALASYLRSLGGQIVTSFRVTSLRQLPPARVVLCDLTPRQLLRIAGEQLPSVYRRTLQHYRYGMAAFKVDWALDAPIPWRAAECTRAGTVHLGGTLEEIAAYELSAWRGRPSGKPYIILAQHTLFDPSRAPAGRHTAWAYCHLPNGSTLDMLEPIELQIERFAPGFRRHVLARSVMPPSALEQHNANLVGGDINGGVPDVFQLFSRPGVRLYSTPLDRLYLCSSSTPPGGGVHGMCGYLAAQLALRKLRS
jgi:phytoene dehydrogenase-like protein